MSEMEKREKREARQRGKGYKLKLIGSFGGGNWDGGIGVRIHNIEREEAEMFFSEFLFVSVFSFTEPGQGISLRSNAP
jgi:hypothetical protein